MTSKVLIVQCPSCQAEVEWNNDAPHRPFCSLRCKQADFIGWANEEHTIPGDSSYDDLLSKELE
ncbi:MAG: DNA gyrase inhibitor YacG [Pseudomonadales bacterium]